MLAARAVRLGIGAGGTAKTPPRRGRKANGVPGTPPRKRLTGRGCPARGRGQTPRRRKKRRRAAPAGRAAAFAVIWLYGRQLPYGRSSSFSRLCQTFCTSSLSSSASSSLPILVSWSGSVSVVVVVGTMATSADKNS